MYYYTHVYELVHTRAEAVINILRVGESYLLRGSAKSCFGAVSSSQTPT